MTDYEAFLAEHGLTNADMDALAKLGYVMTDDDIDMKPSPIHGTGIFARTAFNEGDIVCFAQVNGQRTQAGRFVNHDPHPNVIMVRMPDALVYMATRAIVTGEEILLDYRQAYYESDFAALRDKVQTLEDHISQLPQIDCPVTHHFAPGVYMREMFIPAGVTLTGATHKTSHLSLLVKGHIYLVGDTETVELRAPATVLSQAGTKRAIHAVEDAIWTTVHATDTTDIDQLVEELTTSKADELLGGANNVQLKYQAQQQLRG